MLNAFAFANSISILIALFYIVLQVLRLIAPAMFTFLLNAQFIGANVASLLPESSFGTITGTGIAIIASSWVITYLWAWLYNRMLK